MATSSTKTFEIKTVPIPTEIQEEIEADTTVSDLAIGFNVNYLLDALSALRDEEVIIQLRDSNSSALVRESSSEKSRFISLMTVTS